MDIEKLKKVNQLAVSLRQRGLAQGRDDAARLAGEMNFGMEDDGFNKVMSCSEPENISADAQSEKHEASGGQEALQQEHQQPSSMDEEKILGLLQNFADQFCQEINALNDKVASQERLLGQMKDYLEQLNSQPNQQPSQQAQQSETQQQQQHRQEKQETISVKQDEKKDSPRSGSYASDDVSIEKIFYYGKK